MSIPIGNLIGGTFGEALNHMVPAAVICNRCRLPVAAADYRDHREKECPALFPEEED
jgi:hypothetical protein